MVSYPEPKLGINTYSLSCALQLTFPEEGPLCIITASSTIRALTKFFSTFELPEIVQTDQGSVFQSKTFKQVLKSPVVSSAHWVAVTLVSGLVREVQLVRILFSFISAIVIQ